MGFSKVKIEHLYLASFIKNSLELTALYLHRQYVLMQAYLGLPLSVVTSSSSGWKEAKCGRHLRAEYQREPTAAQLIMHRIDGDGILMKGRLFEVSRVVCDYGL